MHEYSEQALQWVIRAHLSEADANPTTTTFLIGHERQGLLGTRYGNILAGAGAPPPPLTS